MQNQEFSSLLFLLTKWFNIILVPSNIPVNVSPETIWPLLGSPDGSNEHCYNLSGSVSS